MSQSGNNSRVRKATSTDFIRARVGEENRNALKQERSSLAGRIDTLRGVKPKMGPRPLLDQVLRGADAPGTGGAMKNAKMIADARKTPPKPKAAKKKRSG